MSTVRRYAESWGGRVVEQRGVDIWIWVPKKGGYLLSPEDIKAILGVRDEKSA